MLDKNIIKKNFSAAKNYDNFTTYHNLTLKMISFSIKEFFDRCYGGCGTTGNSPRLIKKINILDIGCGTAQGYFTAKNAALGRPFDYFGLDFALGLLKEAERKLTGGPDAVAADNAYLICGDAEYLPLKEKKFDVIFSNMTLHWLNNADNFLEGCEYALKDGGMIILSFLIAGTLKELEDNFKNMGGGAEAGIRLHKFPEIRSIKEKIDKTGLRINGSNIFEYSETAGTSFKLLKRINMLGAKNALGAKITGALSLRKSLLRYDKHYRNKEGNVFCTYKIAYLTLEKQ